MGEPWKPRNERPRETDLRECWECRAADQSVKANVDVPALELTDVELPGVVGDGMSERSDNERPEPLAGRLAQHAPTTDREPLRYLARDDRPERNHRDGTHRTAGSDHPSAVPSSQNPRRSAWCGAGTSLRGRRQLTLTTKCHREHVQQPAPISWLARTELYAGHRASSAFACRLRLRRAATCGLLRSLAAGRLLWGKRSNRRTALAT
jgi:hypothetical protein